MNIEIRFDKKGKIIPSYEAPGFYNVKEPFYYARN